MTKIAIIGGTGLTRLDDFKLDEQNTVTTRWGDPSAPLSFGQLAGYPVVFLPRHGNSHHLPPHKINYRANIQALKDTGIQSIIAVAAVGAIDPELGAADIVIPDQIIDYTWGRSSTFYEDSMTPVTHIDFSWPYSQQLRQRLIQTANDNMIPIVEQGVYGCTQGPRLETAAEIIRMERDGCTLVGMTGMPEAALARELEMDYACCAVIANAAAGKSSDQISMEDIEETLRIGMKNVYRLLNFFVADFSD